MTDFVFNVSKGKIAWYAGLTGGANDGLVAILLRTAGLESDAVLIDKDTFADVVSGATDEETTGVLTNYARKALTNVAATVVDGSDWVNIDCDDIVYTSLGGALNDTPGAVIICYDPDTTGGTDADLIPLTKHGITLTPDGSNVTLTVTNFARAS